MLILAYRLAGPLAVGLTIPAFALGQPETPPPIENAQPPATAYGVICQRPARQQEQRGRPQSGTPFSRCRLRTPGRGRRSAVDREAARAACRHAFSPSQEGREFGECVASTRNLVLKLRGLKAQS